MGDERKALEAALHQALADLEPQGLDEAAALEAVAAMREAGSTCSLTFGPGPNEADAAGVVVQRSHELPTDAADWSVADVMAAMAVEMVPLLSMVAQRAVLEIREARDQGQDTTGAAPNVASLLSVLGGLPDAAEPEPSYLGRGNAGYL